jgi:hypothetical protein
MDDRTIITAPNGSRIDITTPVRELVIAGSFPPYDFPASMQKAEKFGRKLVIVAGPDAPAAVLSAIADAVPAEYRAHLSALWAPLAAEDDDPV